MKYLVKLLCLTATTALVTAAGPVGVSHADDVFTFRVAFADVAAAPDLASGHIARGIDMLHEQLESGDDEGTVLAALCGAYVLNHDLVRAKPICSKAVHRFPGKAAFNNRGVLRAMLGDIEGARHDFHKARPRNLDLHLEQLHNTDVGLVANGNYERVLQIAGSRSGRDIRSASLARTAGADVELLEQ